MRSFQEGALDRASAPRRLQIEPYVRTRGRQTAVISRESSLHRASLYGLDRGCNEGDLRLFVSHGVSFLSFFIIQIQLWSVVSLHELLHETGLKSRALRVRDAPIRLVFVRLIGAGGFRVDVDRVLVFQRTPLYRFDRVSNFENFRLFVGHSIHLLSERTLLLQPAEDRLWTLWISAVGMLATDGFLWTVTGSETKL
jgi:hypothetical protein